MPARVLVDLHVVITESAVLVGQSAINQLFQLVDAERFELENLRARNERAVDVEEWIVSGRANQSQLSAFDSGTALFTAARSTSSSLKRSCTREYRGRARLMPVRLGPSQRQPRASPP